jgi:hypothetical protein
MCGGAGDLACCDTCPRVFHLGCLGVPSVDPHNWSCPVCMGAMPPRPDYRGNLYAPPYGYAMPMLPPPMHAISSGMPSGSDAGSRHHVPPLQNATMMPPYGDPSRYAHNGYMTMQDYGFPYGMNPTMMYGNGFGGMPYGMMPPPPHHSNGVHPPQYAMGNPSDSAPRPPTMNGGMPMYSNGYTQAEMQRKPRAGPANESELDAVSALVSVRATPLAPSGTNFQAELLDFMTKAPLRDSLDDVNRKALHQIVLAGSGTFMDAFVKTASKYAKTADKTDLYKDILRICDAWINKLPAPVISSPRPAASHQLPSPSFPSQLAGMKRPRSPLETETMRDGDTDRGFVNGFPPPTRRMDSIGDASSPLTTGVATPLGVAATAPASQPPNAVPDATRA